MRRTMVTYILCCELMDAAHGKAYRAHHLTKPEKAALVSVFLRSETLMEVLEDMLYAILESREAEKGEEDEVTDGCRYGEREAADREGRLRMA